MDTIGKNNVTLKFDLTSSLPYTDHTKLANKKENLLARKTGKKLISREDSQGYQKSIVSQMKTGNAKSTQERFYVGAGGTRAPYSLCSQIQKLAGKIFKQFKMPIFPLQRQF